MRSDARKALAASPAPNGHLGTSLQPPRPTPDLSVLPGDARTVAEIQRAIRSLTAAADPTSDDFYNGYLAALTDLGERLEVRP